MGVIFAYSINIKQNLVNVHYVNWGFPTFSIIIVLCLHRAISVGDGLLLRMTNVGYILLLNRCFSICAKRHLYAK